MSRYSSRVFGCAKNTRTTSASPAVYWSMIERSTAWARAFSPWGLMGISLQGAAGTGE